MNLKNLKILVTGADGFIGSHLTERLVEIGANVKALSFYNAYNSIGWLDDIDKKSLVLLLIFNFLFSIFFLHAFLTIQLKYVLCFLESLQYENYYH